MSRIVLQDVAREVGTSVATVSRVLNGRGLDRISPATQTRVRETAERLGYAVDHAARAMRTGRTMVIGVSVQELTSPHAARLVEEVERQCSETGFEVLLGLERGRPLEELKRLCDRQVDGLIMVRGAEVHDPNGVLDGLVGRHDPLVCLGPRPHPGVAAVDWDRRAAARALAGPVVEGGARRLLLVGDAPSPGMGEREAGLREAAPGGTVETIYLAASGGGGDRDGSQPVHDFLVEQLEAKGPDAVFVQSTHHVWPVAAAASRLGRTIPDALRLAALSSTVRPEWCDPPLTDLTVDEGQMVRGALSALKQAIAGEAGPKPIPVQRVPARVNWRSSTESVFPRSLSGKEFAHVS